MLEAASATNAYLAPYWFRNLEATNLEPGATARFYVAEKDGHPLAMFAAQAPAGREGSRLHRFRMIGPTLASLTSYQSAMFEIAVAPDADEPEEAVRQLARFIRREKPSWRALELSRVPSTNKWLPIFVAEVRALGWVGALQPDGIVPGYHFGPDETSWSAYAAGRSHNFRKQLQRDRKRLSKQGELRFEPFQNPDQDFDSALVAFDQVAARGWKDREEFADYVPGLVREGAAAGDLRLAILWVGDRPAAAELWLVRGGHATALKGHYDEQFAHDSPGFVIMAHMLEYLLERDSITSFDLGHGSGDYKFRWTNDITHLLAFTAFNLRTLGGWLIAAQCLPVVFAKHVARKLLPNVLLGALRQPRQHFAKWRIWKD